MPDVLHRLRSSTVTRKRCLLSTPNLNFLIACRKDPQFRDTVIRSDLSVADGMPILWVAKLLGIPLPERVSGSSIFEQLALSNENVFNVYFFGGHDGVAELACKRTNSPSRGLRCVGFASPGFGTIQEMSTSGVLSEINGSGADFLIVSLGAKKGTRWIEFNLPLLNVPIVSHLGAVVNFASGTLARAPHWVQRAGLEWLWRIKEEPGLWKRYFFDGIAFIRLLLTHVIPYFWLTRFYLARHKSQNTSQLTIDKQAGVSVMTLSGTWVASNLDTIRVAFDMVVANSADIRLDMSGVDYVDSAFLGLLMLVFAHQQCEGKNIDIVYVSLFIRRIFKLSCAEFLLNKDDGCVR